MLLYYKGLVSEVNDIDLVVAFEHAKLAEAVLDEIGAKRPPNPNRDYATRYFAEYEIDGVEVDVSRMRNSELNALHSSVDVMAGFRIIADGITVEYVPDPQTFETMALGGTTVYLCPLEDWYVLYLLMTHREEKVATIQDYFLKNGANKAYLEAWADRCIPVAVSNQIRQLLIELNPRDK